MWHVRAEGFKPSDFGKKSERDQRVVSRLRIRIVELIVEILHRSSRSRNWKMRRMSSAGR